jgi:protein O-mannosyl-transferase
MFHLKATHASILFGILLLVVLGVTYSLALPGYFLFDDTGNLERLSNVVDLQSWLGFVTAGEAGPLGRPVTLASFALQANAWPENTAAFLRANVGIHVANTLLVFLLATGLASLRKPSDAIAPVWVGLFTAMLWAASPFLANSSLLIIQRMATLAGFFMFAGLTAFVWAHHESMRAPRVRWSLLALFAACIPLAAYSKENGALLPVLAALIYLVWIPRQNLHRGIAERGFYLVFVAIPAAAVLVYIASRVPEIISSGYGPRRHFTPEERLLSQPLILWDYVRNLLIPRAASAAPFTDHWPAATGFLSPPAAGLALFAWIAVVGAAVALWNKARWLIFGIGFFLSAHLVESSVFGLELYFAHRNYVPAFGIYFGLVWALFSLPQEHLNAPGRGTDRGQRRIHRCHCPGSRRGRRPCDQPSLQHGQRRRGQDRGARAATGDILVFMDADGQHDPEDIGTCSPGWTKASTWWSAPEPGAHRPTGAAAWPTPSTTASPA